MTAALTVSRYADGMACALTGPFETAAGPVPGRAPKTRTLAHEMYEEMRHKS